MKAGDIKNIEAEAGVIASILLNPELTFYSEYLRPNYFTDTANAYIYYAVSELAKLGVEHIDEYNIINFLNTKKGTRQVADNVNSIITVQSLQELIHNANLIARTEKADYDVIASAVADAAFRRNTYQRLVECERFCFNGTDQDLEQKIYNTLDNVMMEFSCSNDVPLYKDVVEDYWSDIQRRQNPGDIGAMKFKFPTLNDYVMIERGELVIFGAEQKQGKSMMLLNCAVSLLQEGRKVLYLDSELNSRLFTCRMISHLTGIEFRRVRSGDYDESEAEKIQKAIAWLKTRDFVHVYMPIFDEKTIYKTFKKVYHQQGVDVLIVDYFKSTGEGDAYAVYSLMGSLVDMIKNKIAGESNIAAIGAAQSTSSGRLADSAKIARNASTILLLQDKTPEEIEADGGPEYGNKKLIVKFNRNGPQHADGEYIDLNFCGDKILYEEAKQHIPTAPY